MKKILVLLPLLLLFTGCASLCPVARTEGSLQHVVLLWLKDAGNVEQREQIMAVSKTFAEIPSVQYVRVGQVIPSDRDIVDSSYDVGLIVTVANEQDLADYIAHPIHQKAKNEVLVPLVSKIVVYDFAQ